MAYTHSKYEVIVAKTQSVASAADIGTWAPGYMPHIIRAVAMIFDVSANATGVTKVDKRPTAGSDTGRGDGDIAILNYTTAVGAQGLVVYKDGLDIELLPGEEAVFEVTDATPTAGSAHLILYVEPRWEYPSNISDMSATT
jgi:hypothetical protein